MSKKDLIIKECKKLKLKNKYNLLMPEEVLEAARNENSALHNEFTWDKNKAAYAYNLWEARQLIARVQIEDDGGEKMFYHCKFVINEEKAEGYVTKEDFDDKEIYYAVLKEAVVSLRYWQKKYKEIKELGGIINEDNLGKIEKKI
jgi:hypothetical protein